MLGKIRLKLEKIPSEYRRWSAFGVLLALLLALPITIWGLTSGRFEVRERAVTSEITPVPSVCKATNGVIDVSPAGGSGTCHDIQTAIDAAKEDEEVHVHAGTYEVPIHVRNGKRVGLYINKKIFFESDYPNTHLLIRGADEGVFVDGVDVSISGWRINFKDITDSGIWVMGYSSERYVYLGVLDLVSEGSVPRLVTIQGLNGQLSSGGGRSGIFESKFAGAEDSAINLAFVDNFDVQRNEISNSTEGIRGYSHNVDLKEINVRANTINHVRAGIVFETDSAYRVRNTYFRDNKLSDFGFDEYYKDEATKHGITALGGINLSYGAEVGIVSNILRDGGGIGVFLQGGGNVMVEKNLIINNQMSINMSGGSASYINNTVFGNSNRNGGGVAITKGSSFINNIVANVGSYHGAGYVSDQCGLKIHYGDCANFNDSRIRYNDFWNNERIFCSDSGQCPFAYGVNGNISADPLFGEDYCLLPGSPAIYGDVSRGEYMGHRGPCSPVPITPTPTSIPCTPEGQTMPVYPGYQCCPGLAAISTTKPDQYGNCPSQPPLGASVCVKCGNGICGLGENKCNCPEDCLPTPTVAPAPLRLKIKFEGVTSRPADDSDKEVKIYATNLTGGPDLGSANSKETIVVSVDDSGIYHGEIVLNTTYFGYHYRLRVKGPKHLQKVFPDVFFQAGGELDLTTEPLRPGDLNADGKVDREDIKIIDDRMFSTTPADVALADVNFDKRVDIIDRTLVLNTLSVQYDPD